MIRIKAAQAVISTFRSETPRKEDVHGTRYSVTLGLDADEHKRLVKHLTGLSSSMIGAAASAASTLLSKEHDREVSYHSGLIYIDCWGDDNSFSGMLLNGVIFPYEDNDPPRNLVLSEIDVQLSCRIMTKKDKSVVLAWTTYTIDTTGLKPVKDEKTPSKKR